MTLRAPSFSRGFFPVPAARAATRARRPGALAAAALVTGLGVVVPLGAQAQQAAGTAALADNLTWQQCQGLNASKEARLACFDRWAQAQQDRQASANSANTASARLPGAPAPASAETAAFASTPPAAAGSPAPVAPVVVVSTPEGCRDREYSTFSRFWELEEGSDCGTFGFRGYRPLNVSASAATKKPGAPTSPSAGHDGEVLGYQANEMRIGLSVRTKLAEGLLTQNDPVRKDSLWFGYTQQSNWQILNSELSRPFRTTDHEPEMMYVYPTLVGLPGGWRWSYLGLGVAHQSNGQTLPLSRSWNRTYLMAGFELGDRFQLAARLWKRWGEDADKDDNPDISSYIGRAEFAGRWNYDRDNTFGVTLRNNMRSSGHGSLRLEWFKAIGDPVTSNLRFHTQLFHGYGDTLVDYNRKRTVLSIGQSLVDF